MIDKIIYGIADWWLTSPSVNRVRRWVNKKAGTEPPFSLSTYEKPAPIESLLTDEDLAIMREDNDPKTDRT